MKNLHLNLLRLLRCLLFALPLGLAISAPAHAADDGGQFWDHGTITSLEYNADGQVESFKFKAENNQVYKINIPSPNDRHTENLQRFKDDGITVKVTWEVTGDGNNLVKYSE